jgi:hypothetical protein
MALERIYFVGTGYRFLDSADVESFGVCLSDVSVVRCARTMDGEPVVCLYSPTGALLCALPWPSGVSTDAGAVRWWLDAAAALAAAAPW